MYCTNIAQWEIRIIIKLKKEKKKNRFGIFLMHQSWVMIIMNESVYFCCQLYRKKLFLHLNPWNVEVLGKFPIIWIFAGYALFFNLNIYIYIYIYYFSLVMSERGISRVTLQFHWCYTQRASNKSSNFLDSQPVMQGERQVLICHFLCCSCHL